MSIDQVVNVVDTAANKLPYIESLYEQAKEEVDNLKLMNSYQHKMWTFRDCADISAKSMFLRQQ